MLCLDEYFCVMSNLTLTTNTTQCDSGVTARVTKVQWAGQCDVWRSHQCQCWSECRGGATCRPGTLSGKAANEPSASQLVFTIMEKAPTGWKYLLELWNLIKKDTMLNRCEPTVSRCEIGTHTNIIIMRDFTKLYASLSLKIVSDVPILHLLTVGSMPVLIVP